MFTWNSICDLDRAKARRTKGSLTSQEAKLCLDEADRDRGDLESNLLHEKVKVHDNLASTLLCLKFSLNRLIILIEL